MTREQELEASLREVISATLRMLAFMGKGREPSPRLQRGMPLVKVSKWAGHANIKITAGTYGHLEIGDLIDAVDLIDGSEPARGLKAVS